MLSFLVSHKISFFVGVKMYNERSCTYLPLLFKSTIVTQNNFICCKGFNECCKNAKSCKS